VELPFVLATIYRAVYLVFVSVRCYFWKLQVISFVMAITAHCQGSNCQGQADHKNYSTLAKHLTRVSALDVSRRNSWTDELGNLSDESQIVRDTSFSTGRTAKRGNV
jgi:hypothetical protein